MAKEKIAKDTFVSAIKKIIKNTDNSVGDMASDADPQLYSLYNAVDAYDEKTGLSLVDNLQAMMDSDGIMLREDAIAKEHALLKDLKTEDDYLNDPDYDTYTDNLGYLQDSDDTYVGPLWHGNFTGDRQNFDAVHAEDVNDMAKMFYDYVAKGKIDGEWPLV